MCRKASDRILAFTRPRAKGGVVFGTKAFDSLCMIVLCCDFFKWEKKPQTKQMEMSQENACHGKQERDDPGGSGFSSKFYYRL